MHIRHRKEPENSSYSGGIHSEWELDLDRFLEPSQLDKSHHIQMWNQRVPDTHTQDIGAMPLRGSSYSIDGHYIPAVSSVEDVSVSSTVDQSPYSAHGSINMFLPNELAGAGSQYTDGPDSICPSSPPSGGTRSNRNENLHATQDPSSTQSLMSQGYIDYHMDHNGYVNSSMHPSSGNHGLLEIDPGLFNENSLTGNASNHWTDTWTSYTNMPHSSWPHHNVHETQPLEQMPSSDYEFMESSSWHHSTSGYYGVPSQRHTHGVNGHSRIPHRSCGRGPAPSVNIASRGVQLDSSIDPAVSYEDSLSPNPSETLHRSHGDTELNAEVTKPSINSSNVGNSVRSPRFRTEESKQAPKDRTSRNSVAAQKKTGKSATPSTSGSESGKRSIGKNDTSDARQRIEYQQGPRKDGMYHCYFEDQEGCEHAPTKLKCNYDKYIDSHLRPHECKEKGCEELRFSSAACKLRHEREAHGSHGHGVKPFLCKYKDCERSKEGYGFPRSWNCNDHMKRMHDHTTSPSESASPSQVQDYVLPQMQEPKRKRYSTDAGLVESDKKQKATIQRPVVEPSPAESKLDKLLAREIELEREWCQRQTLMRQRMEQLVGPKDRKTVHLLREDISHLGNVSGLLADIAAQLKKESGGRD